MSQPLPLEPPRHIHYCNDVEDTDTCFDRGFCICECGATAPVITGKDFVEGRGREGVWTLPSDANQSQKGVQE